MVHELFGQNPWRFDRETMYALQRRLEKMGLEERVPGDANTRRATPLGIELPGREPIAVSGSPSAARLSQHGFAGRLVTST
jgi:hypothetical protein